MNKILRITLIGFFICSMLHAQKGFLSSTELESWPKDHSISVPENHNRVSSYLFLINKNKYIELFNMVNYNRSLRNKAGLKKNDELQYLYMGVDFALPDSDSISVPLFLFDVKNPASVKKFEQYDGKLLDNINTNNMRTNLNGTFKVKAMLSRESSGFWKELVKITTDVAKSASQLMIGNPFGASELLTCFQGRVSTGLEELGTLSGSDNTTTATNNTITQEHSFLINLVEYNKNPDYREVVVAARLYRVHWSFDKNRNKSKFFRNIDADDFPGPENFKSVIRNYTYPMILVVETRFMPKISLTTPEFVDAYQKSITDEYKDFAESEQEMFKQYVKNFDRAYTIQKNLESYIKNIHTNNQSLKSSLLIEAIEESFLYRQNVLEENAKYEYIPGTPASISRYGTIGNRYDAIERKLKRLYDDNKYNEPMANSYVLLKSLLNPVEGKDTSSETLYREISKLSYFNDILANVTPESYQSKKSYIRYTALLKTYESALYEKLTGEDNANAKTDFYEKLMTDYDKCNFCVAECQKEINDLQKKEVEEEPKILTPKVEEGAETIGEQQGDTADKP
ncbi:hypothetical protein NBRC110019_20230 [Neptunitalea chrysea]|uniref:Uncharacterized protein n=1 Tax=Neptunitalea chrysea TaxID=1647581 RepID=A0A9W6B5F7_9FLAO|nr:hypothetical protein [Neptunitalea chrysea]GLB52983.1 hypothetical protein NBRC110019_20230 [Neptunitalea chrysea]